MSDLTPIEQRFRIANPVPNPSNPPMTASSAAAALLDIDARSIDIQTQVQQLPDQPLTESPAPNRRSMVALALAAAAVIIVIVAVALFNDADENTQIDVVTQAPESLSFGADFSLALVDDYFAARDTGDLAAVLALFTREATVSDANGRPYELRPGWEPRLAWDMAQETTFTSPDCTMINEVGTGLLEWDATDTRSSVTVRCEYDSHDAVARAAGAVTPLTATLTITPKGIHDLQEIYGRPSYLDIGEPFNVWLAREYPDDADAAGCYTQTTRRRSCSNSGATIEESVARGELRASLAAEWGAYLEANGCTYPDHDC